MNNKSLGFNLFLDEDMADAMNYIFSVYCSLKIERDPSLIFSPDFVKYDKNIVDTFTRISEEIHKLGWCKDPDCLRKNEKDTK